MPKVNKSRYAILGMLSLRPMSGYDIRKAVQRSVGFFWSESYGQIYPILKRLVADGLATQHTERRAGRPERIVYRLTDAGLQALQQWLMLPADPEVLRSEMLLKLFFGCLVPAADVRRQVEAERERTAAALLALSQIEKFLAQHRAGDPHLPYMQLTIDYGKHTANAVLQWCDGARGILAQIDTPAAHPADPLHAATRARPPVDRVRAQPLRSRPPKRKR